MNRDYRVVDVDFVKEVVGQLHAADNDLQAEEINNLLEAFLWLRDRNAEAAKELVKLRAIAQKAEYAFMDWQ